MNERKKYALIGAIAGLVSGSLIALINSVGITGITLVALILIAFISGWVSVSSLIASITKKPAKTFRPLVSFFAWPF